MIAEIAATASQRSYGIFTFDGVEEVRRGVRSGTGPKLWCQAKTRTSVGFIGIEYTIEKVGDRGWYMTVERIGDGGLGAAGWRKGRTDR